MLFTNIDLLGVICFCGQISLILSPNINVWHQNWSTYRLKPYKLRKLRTNRTSPYFKTFGRILLTIIYNKGTSWQDHHRCAQHKQDRCMCTQVIEWWTNKQTKIHISYPKTPKVVSFRLIFIGFGLFLIGVCLACTTHRIYVITELRSTMVMFS